MSRSGELRIERLGPEDWQRLRAIRLRALADAPDAFSSLYAESAAEPDEFWHRRIVDPGFVQLLASDGRDLGMAVVGPGRDGQGGLYGVWVDPSARGLGVGDALMRAAIEVARKAGYERIYLEVANNNAAAIALYARFGWEPTGVLGAMPPPREHILEHERVLVL